ncbi:hypothetical protein QVD17_39615 [Tagetes erecta]|uniref:holo-[acyl-carrier-protein] synthase n=1 Tax=Tagetes erecta TaxID=13708 RepID=A0AAD8NHB1_TARER|nr:hypothetical protein QVD17_39615 [Tagetes erecta]
MTTTTIVNWDPSPHQFSIAMSILPQQQHSSITRFMKIEDRKRALVSRLLQYALVIGIPFHEIVFNRTAQGKLFKVAVAGDVEVWWWLDVVMVLEVTGTHDGDSRVSIRPISR